MADFEIHKGLKERRDIELKLEPKFVDWLIDTYCSCLVAYYHLSVSEIRKYYYEWKDSNEQRYETPQNVTN